MGWKGRRFALDTRLIGGVVVSIALLTSYLNTDLQSPPRFDGAGYAVLAESLATGRGYSEIDHPAAPRHSHFPPGYPACLALIWRVTGGRSVQSAHVFSILCTCAAVFVAWLWLRAMYAPRVAGLLGLALAFNWTWERTGGAIQSEPLFLLLEQLVLLVSLKVGKGKLGRFGGVLLGFLLAASILTRHVGLVLIPAVGIFLLLQKRRSSTLVATLIAGVLLIPWLVWLVQVRGNTQAALLRGEGLPSLLISQILFYMQRLPDQLTGPLVEIGTVFLRSGWIGTVVNLWAALASGTLIVGWISTLRTPKRRLVSLYALGTLALLLIWPFQEAGRFLIPLVPCMLVGATETLARIARLARLSQVRTVAAVLLLAVSVPYSGYAIFRGSARTARATHEDFDAACTWIAVFATQPGVVLTRHPGELYWQTGRHALVPSSTDPETIGREIADWAVVYLLVDDERYVNAPVNVLAEFVRKHPDSVREVWSRESGRRSVRVFAVKGAGN